MQKSNSKKTLRKPQQQQRPGYEFKMQPKPVFENKGIPSVGKLNNKVALITGGDSGIGRAVAVLFAKEGADISIVYLNEKSDAIETKRIIEVEHGRRCMLIATDISKERNCKSAVQKTVKGFLKIDV
ncbi:MAG: SDR family NAD(P)-dependent oxidoreductase, partial [Chitinophagales bacterium]